MPITPTDLLPIVYDPTQMQQLILSNVTNFTINDPTNPFVMLVEAATVLAAAATTETVSAMNKMYPSLATNNADILHHVGDKELTNLFSNPSETNIVFYLNIRDIKSNANYVSALGYRETFIQAGTEVIVTGIPFTLHNDIHIKLYDTGAVFAEQLTSTSTLANNTLGVLSAGIVSFQDGEPWIAVETIVKQIKMSVITKTLTVSEGFKLNVKHTDKYHYSDISFRNNNTGNEWVPMLKSHSDTHINPDTPTMFITLLDNLTIYSIPDVYLLSGQVSGEVRITLYETVGYLDLPIYKYQMSEYVVNLNLTTNDPIRASAANIITYANSRDVVNGGTTGYTFTELKDSIISNTLGNGSLPITLDQLGKAVSLYGFELYKAIDLITERVMIATRNLTRYDSALISTKPDVFFNTVNLITSEITNPKIIVADTYTLIPANTLFKEVNGIVTTLSSTELTYLASLKDTDLITHISNSRLFFTPYYYAIDTTTPSAETRVYDLDTPDLKDIKIIGKNINIIERCNIGKYGINKTDTGYELAITILSNTEFKNTNFNLLVGQLGIELYDGSSIVYYEGVYNAATELMVFKIPTNFNLDVNNQLELTNGISDISNVFAKLVSNATIYLISTDPVITDTSNYLINDIKLPYDTYTVLDKEVITITFGQRIDYIWNKMFTTYTDRKYLTHTTSKPLVYKQDVYEPDPLTGSIIRVTTINGVSTTYKTLLHASGTPVLDSNGVAVMEYNAGDIVLDANGLPTVDMVGGVIWHMDILMLEYEYLVANSNVSKNYLGVIKDTLKGWMLNNLVSVNNKVLENTKVMYRSNKSALPVEISVESVKTVIPYTVKPIITIYSTRLAYTPIEMTNLKTEIGYLLHTYLDKQYINLEDLKKEIITNVDTTIASVKISGIDTYRDSDVFNTTNPTARLTLNKILVINSTGEYIVNYDIDVKVHNV